MLRPPRRRRRRRAAPLRRAPARRAGRQGARAGLVPHVLHMTATPIPRTMALLRYGDLDVTTLRELPKGRQPIDDPRRLDRARARAGLRAHPRGARAGRQAFVVCPLVEESEALQARAATAEFERLRGGELADFRVVLLHGQMRPREKQEAMAALRRRAAPTCSSRRPSSRSASTSPTRRSCSSRTPSATASASCTSCAAASGAASTRRCACSSGRRSRRGCGRWPSTPTASSWPRSTSSCAARAS